MYDASLITKDIGEFELPVLEIPKLVTLDKEVVDNLNLNNDIEKKAMFDFSEFINTKGVDNQKSDIQRFLNEHFKYIGKEFNES